MLLQLDIMDMRLLLEIRFKRIAFFLLMLTLLFNTNGYAQYCGPLPIIDKCNPNRLALQIEIIDISSNLVNRNKDEKKYEYKLDCSVWDNQLYNQIHAWSQIQHNSLFDITSPPHNSLANFSINDYLVKDLPNFNLIFKFQLSDVKFTKSVRIYQNRAGKKRDFRHFRRNQMGAFLPQSNSLIKEIAVPIPLTIYDECIYDTIYSYPRQPLTKTTNAYPSNLNEHDNEVNFPLEDRLIRYEFPHPNDIVVKFEGGITFLIKIRWERQNKDATKMIVNHPNQTELNLCTNEYPYVFRGGNPEFETSSWANVPPQITNTLRECLYVETPSQVGSSIQVNYVSTSNSTGDNLACLNALPIKLKTIQEPNLKITPGRDTLICRGQTVKFTVPSAQIDYKWFKIFKIYTDACGRLQADKECIAKSDTFLNVSEPGLYMAEIRSANGCLVYDTVEVFGSKIPAVKIGATTNSICAAISSSANLSVINAQNYSSINWSTPTPTAVTVAGKYWISAVDINHCNSSDTIEITGDACDALYDGQLGHSVVKQQNVNTIDPANNINNTILLIDNPTTTGNDVMKQIHFVKLNYHRSGHSDVEANNYKVKVAYKVFNNGTAINSVADTLMVCDINNTANLEKVYQAINAYAITQTLINPTVTISSIQYFDESGTLLSVASVPAAFKNDINIEFEHKTYLVPEITGSTTISTSDIAYDFNAIDRKLTIAWKPKKEAVEYELQWAFKDKYANEILSTADLLKNRGISINTAENYYVLDLAYPKGTLYYRVRPVGRFTVGTKNNYEHIRYGAWSDPLSYTIDNTNVFDSTRSWQRTSTYAEEGKKKEVISYYDEFLRTGQVVTNLNTEKLSLIAETHYDYEGRPVLNVLPVPMDSNNLKFKADLNKVSGHVINKDDFSKGMQPALDITSGAAKYYSANNPFINNTKFYANTAKIPSANGYVTTEVQYMRDGTGRVVKQSGVGSEFALDTAENTQKHYTQYFYSSVPDNELVRLFGSNTGNAKHYQKNYVIDPNDQISTSYVDMYGRTVATCLTGQVPSNLAPIGVDSGNYVMPLNNNNIIDKQGHTISLSYTFGNTIKAQNNRDTFFYDLQGAINQVTGAIDICQTCQYKLFIKVTDPNGKLLTLNPIAIPTNAQIVDNTSLEATFGKGVACAAPSISYDSIVFDAVINKIGTYTVTKELKILTDPIDSLVLDSIPGVVSFEHFKDSLLHNFLDSTSCNFGCEQYVIRFLKDSLKAQNIVFDTLANSDHRTLYHEFYNKWCNGIQLALADSFRLAQQNCESIYEQIKSQVSPGGLYFTPNFIITYKDSIRNFQHYTGTSAAIMDSIKKNWKEIYADSLAIYHPEYCHYITCIGDSTDATLNVKLSLVFSWSEAQALGYTDNSFYQNADPALYSLYQSKLNNFHEVVINNNVLGNPHLSLAEFVDYTLPSAPYTPAVLQYYNPREILYANVDFTNYPSDAAVLAKLDTLRWFHFRDLLISIKEEAKAKQTEANGCRYLPADSAIVQYPIPNRGQQPSGAEADSIIASICKQTCDGFADRYLHRILTYCKGGITLTSADSIKLKQLLTDYCTGSCGISNPIGLFNPGDTSSTATDSIRNFLTNAGFSCPWDSITVYGTPIKYHYLIDSLTGDTAKVTICTPDGIEALMTFVKGKRLNYYTNDTAGLPEAINTLEQWGVDTSRILIKNDHITFVKGQNGNCNDAPCVSTFYFLDSLGNKIHKVKEIIWANRIYQSPLGQGDLYQYYSNQIIPYFSQYEAIVIDEENDTLKYRRAYLYMLNYNWQGSGCGLDFKGKCTAKPITIWQIDTTGISDYFNPVPDSCLKEVTQEAVSIIKDFYKQYTDSLRLALYNAYIDNCFNIKERFLLKYKLVEYQYTLYYYDLAGNLVQTIPPQGVYPLGSNNFDGDGNRIGYTEPQHVLKTQYRYNTRNQVVWQKTPDADSTVFWYNAKGQLILSQNAKQKPQSKFSVTFYDHLGRILCVGEVDSTKAHFKIDSTLLDTKFPLLARYTPSTSITQITLNKYDNPLNVPIADFKQLNLRNRVSATYYADKFTSDNLIKQNTSPDNTDILLVPEVETLLSGNTTLTAYTYDEVGNVKSLVQKLEQTAYGLAAIVDTLVNDEFATDNTATWVKQTPGNSIVATHNTSSYSMRISNPGTQASNTFEKSITPALIPASYLLEFDISNLPSPLTNSTNLIIFSVHNVATSLNASIPIDTIRTNGHHSISFTMPNTPLASSTVLRLRAAYLKNNNYFDIDNIRLIRTTQGQIGSLASVDKRVDYDYDLISGKVNKVTYQANKPDLFIHKYEYDADNRITDVYTSRDGIIETHEAKYFYYPHGPLARVEIGQDKVQGMDYYYTLQGWLKGINSSAVMEDNDPGKDSVATGNARDTLNKYTPKDQFNTLLSYYKGDYFAVDGSSAAAYEFNNATMPFYNGQANNKFKGLYNGNIAFIANGLPALANGAANKSLSWMLDEYKYDQLNRIINSQTTLPNTAGNDYLNGVTSKARTSYQYDKNGNITRLNRTGYSSGTGTTMMDSLTYSYAVNTGTGKLENNKLYHVSDIASSSAFTEDIDDEGSFTPPNQSSTTNTNYAYDAIGQLTADKSEKIDSIQWNVYGKISRIYYKGGKPGIQFLYDATGNRIAKLLKNTNSTAAKDTTYASTYYWRDAQGNVLATESKKYYALPSATTGGVSHTTEVEYNIYGSSRLGTLQDTIPYDVTTLTPYGKYVRYFARRQYELSNHLGNVMATVSDVKTYSSGYRAKVLSAQNYYPFGMQMPGKTFNLTSYSSLNKYRFGFNGMEKDDEVSGNGNQYDYGFRIYNPRLGKFLSLDPLTTSYPMLTPYQFSSNRPIDCIDLDGLEAVNAQDIDALGLGGVGIKLETSGDIIKFSHTWSIIPLKPKTVNFQFKKTGISLQDIMKVNEGDGFFNKAGRFISTVFTKDLGLLEHADELNNSKGLAGPLDALGSAFIQFSGSDDDKWNGIAINTYRHVFGQALLTTLYGSNFAKYVGDAHERDENGFLKDTRQVNINDSYADVINNYYGRELGEKYLKDNNISESSEWTDKMTSDFMNYVGDYVLNSFEKTKGKKSKFKKTDEVVKNLTKAINEARD